MLFLYHVLAVLCVRQLIMTFMGSRIFGTRLYPRLDKTYLGLGGVASNGVEGRAIDGRGAEGSPEGSVAETSD